MSEYANHFEQALDGISYANIINNAINSNNMLENMDPIIQEFIINNNVVDDITAEIIEAINSGNANYYYADHLGYTYSPDQIEITVLFLRLASTFIVDGNNAASINNIQQYVINLRNRYTEEEINMVTAVLQLSMMSIMNDNFNINNNNMLIPNNIPINNMMIDDNIDYANVFEDEPDTPLGQHVRNIEVVLHNETIGAGVDCECPVCYCSLHTETFLKTNCNHSYCKDCIVRHVTSFLTKTSFPTCPFCREHIVSIKVPNEELIGELEQTFGELEQTFGELEQSFTNT
jgi:hypothetical protein